ncbi:MAG TPA: nucleotide exchange factor GrpE [Geminocystis sp. M7585_C2015_104]|nr:nucleotide exchange factor GrpE [Geminocystis sp. M7585_C2015_104]
MNDQEKNTQIAQETEIREEQVAPEATPEVATESAGATTATESPETTTTEGEAPQEKTKETTQETQEQQELSPDEKIQNLEATIESLKQELIRTKNELEKTTAQLQAAIAQYRNLQADFDRFRERTSKEKQELEFQVKKRVITALLPTVDNFERARSQIKPANDGEMAIHRSYQGVYKTFVEGLKQLGVSAMRAENQPFDPNYHEALLREPTNEYPEGTVIEQLTRGYMLDGVVLRHAQVKVAVPLETESAPAESQSPPEQPQEEKGEENN